MKVDKYTLYRDFAAVEPYIEAPQLEELRRAAVVDKFGTEGFYGLTIGGLLDGMNGDLSALQDCDGETVFDRYRVAAFGEWLNEFVAVVNALTLKPTPKQIRQAAGCKPLTFEESVYYFVRSYFNLQNFNAVRDLTVGDYIMAKKDDYNKAVIDRNIPTI